MESAQTKYTAPVDQLLTYGAGEVSEPENWPNYLELGLGLEHVPELIRMVNDKELNEAETESLEVWGPIYAWRALGQLRAEAAIEPLIKFQETSDDIDWAYEELPKVLGMIGPAALPPLTDRLTDINYDDELRLNMITDIQEIGNRWPEAHATTVEILTKQLELFEENNPEVNGFLIYALINLQAIETVPLIERAYAARSVDPMMVGDWEDVQVAFGLLTEEEVEQRRARIIDAVPVRNPVRGTALPQPPVKENHQRVAVQKKTKNKMAKQSRKKNRKR